MLDYCETMGERRHFRVVDEASFSRVTATITERWQVKYLSGSGRSTASVHRIVRPDSSV
jgi:hypothetical protein